MNQTKNTNMLLLVITIATLLVTVVGATFAYFQSTTSGQGVSTTLDVEAQASTAQFTASGGQFGFVVTGADMLVADAKDGQVAGTGKGTLTVNLSSTTAAKCTYDVKFAWDSGSSYTPTTGLGANQMEFGVKAELKTSTNATTGTNNIATEKNFDKVVALPNAIVITGATVEVNGTNTAQAVWEFTATMYNLNLNQSDLAGTGSKAYNGAFTVANVVC